MTNVELESALAQIQARLIHHIEWTNKSFNEIQERQDKSQSFMQQLLDASAQSDKRYRQGSLLTTAAFLLKDTGGDIRQAVIQAEALLTEIESGGEWAK